MMDFVNKWTVVYMLTALENEFQKYKPFSDTEKAMYWRLCEIECDIGKLPSADVEEVVRCENCSYSKQAKINEKGFKICPISGMEITDYDFCSYADRRTDDEAD